MAITKLTKCGDIASEFAVALHEAGRMKWYYDNKNPNSPVQPVMAGGKLKDWIGYDHHAVKPFIQFTVPGISFPSQMSSYALYYTASNTIRVKSSNISGWCSISSIDTQYVHFSVQQNYNPTIRSGSVVFETVDGLATATVTISQAAGTKPNITLSVQLDSIYSATIRSSEPVKDNLAIYVMYSINASTQGPLMATLNVGSTSVNISIPNPNYQLIDAIGIESINGWPGDGTYIYETTNAKYYFS